MHHRKSPLNALSMELERKFKERIMRKFLMNQSWRKSVREGRRRYSGDLLYSATGTNVEEGAEPGSL